MIKSLRCNWSSKHRCRSLDAIETLPRVPLQFGEPLLNGGLHFHQVEPQERPDFFSSPGALPTLKCELVSCDHIPSL